MSKLIYSVSIWLFALLLAFPSHAQYVATPPVRDGNISAAEYSNNSFTTADGNTWYMTWDANYLYVAKTKSGGGETEPTIMYLDVDPILPVTGGGSSNGSLTGPGDYGVVPALPFRADVRVYFAVDPNNGNRYIEIRRRDGNGAWGNVIQTNLDFYSTSTGTGFNREIRMSWNTLTNNAGIPASFDWLGYAINTQSGSSNYRYDQAPANPKAFATTGSNAPLMEYYYTVVSTANGSATNPFSLKSYTFLGNYTSNTDNTVVPFDGSFGAISVWDYTMNLAGGQINRGFQSGMSGDWNISGSLVVGNGTLYFGSGGNYGNTNVGNVRVLGNGILDMDQTPKPMYVREDIDLTGGSQFRLSGIIGGDLYVGRNFYVKDGITTTQGTFQAMKRTVFFTGTNVTHTIQANNTSYAVPFNYLTIDGQSSSVVLSSNILVINQIYFNQGLLFTNNYYIQLDGASVVFNETAANHIIGNTRITQTLGTAQSGTKYFGNIGLSLAPQNSTTALGDVTVTRVTGTALNGVGIGSGGASILRYFVLTTPNTVNTGLDLQLQFTYRTDEQNNIPTSNLALYQSPTGTPGTFQRLTMPSASTGTTIAYNYTGTLSSGTYLTLGDGVIPLPVTLVSFTAAPTAQGAALLHWVTATETNSKGFGIERQLGSSTTWQSVGYVAATNSATGSTYDFTDKSLITASASPVAYYRLRQEDFDGTLSYSPVVTVTRPAIVASTELLLSPVPVTGANLSVTFAEAGQAGLEIAVINTQGQSLLHFTTEASSETALSLPVEKLAAGVYIVSVRVPGQPVRHARFVKL